MHPKVYYTSRLSERACIIQKAESENGFVLNKNLISHTSTKQTVSWLLKETSKSKSAPLFRRSTSLIFQSSSLFRKTTMIINLYFDIIQTISQGKKCFAIVSFLKLIVSFSYMHPFTKKEEYAQNHKKCAHFSPYPFVSQIVSLNLPLRFNWNKSNNTKIY